MTAVLPRASTLSSAESRDASRSVVAHRIGTALRADRVLVLEHGRIVEEGPPEKLAEAEGPFARWVAATRAATATEPHKGTAA